MSEGKLFAFHVKHPPSELRQMKNVWLCQECFESWDVTLDTDGKVELCPLERMAQPNGGGNPGFSAKDYITICNSRHHARLNRDC
jgi:hypothetical protein